MNVLLDTHLYIWWLKNDINLSKKARHQIVAADKIYISSASVWEASIKAQLGKLDVDIECLIDSIENEGFIELPVSVKHVANLTKLGNHHRDPFDRILIAQAISEPLRFLTSDKTLINYSELIDFV